MLTLQLLSHSGVVTLHCSCCGHSMLEVLSDAGLCGFLIVVCLQNLPCLVASLLLSWFRCQFAKDTLQS